METLFYNLFTRTGSQLAIYIYHRIATPYLQTIDPTVITTVGEDLAQFGASQTEAGIALEEIIMDQMSLASPSLTAETVTAFMNQLGDLILIDYPPAPTQTP